MRDIRLILTIDGLSSAYLGPYGGSWVATPGINRLASQGCVFDNGVAPSFNVQANFHAAASSDLSLFDQHERAGYRTAVVHEEGDWLREFDFPGEVIEVGSTDLPISQPAKSLSETRMAILLGTAFDQLESVDSKLLLWIHSRGMLGLWDAPDEFVQSVLDEDDPIPPRCSVPPQRPVPDDEDPDVLLGIRQSYAAQVAVLDACIETLLDHPRLQAESSEIFFIGLRGYPLGEHGYVGISDETPLYGESLGVPIIVKSPAVNRQRWRGLTSLSDMPALLMPTAPKPLKLPDQETVCVRHGEQVVLRSQEWMLRRAADSVQLFAKPDDRFECNDVASIMSEVVEQLGRDVE